MALLVRNADVHAPAGIGVRDILCVAGRIVAMGDSIDAGALPFACEVLDAEGAAVAPGFVDCHVHVTGGGGEGGFATRTPELSLAATFEAGVTSVVGVLGTDGVARDMEALVAKIYGLRERGLSAWCLSGSYRVPPCTLTGDLMRDIMMIEPIIGAGEVAISDHRSSKPTAAEFARIAAEARVAGMLSGKAGIVNVHMGDAPAGFAPLREAVSGGDLPRSQFLPTHCARSEALFAEALAWVAAGGSIDLTADGGRCAESYLRALESGASPDRITMSSDGQGSLPVFDADRRLVRMDVGTCASLADTLRALVEGAGLALEKALIPVTSAPAAILKLRGKGVVAEGADADLVVLGEGCRVRHVVAGGRIAVRDGTALMRGIFE